ncbi:hypothetical protein GSS88_03790 [Corynebacterium sp. 3HC-13]|uniref:hypothetical protein n=1 Tax=Corynebacterium poyangense TaxID=2684405 RepID=UPI001CCA5F3D|nr:hypothetical protein [Corynebacterium poyangense]MBZ8176922.1 hypothetical protein [Corynebacterium poyangense]
MALITAKWGNSLEKFEDLQEQLVTKIEVDLNPILRTKTALITGSVHYKNLNHVSGKQLEETWPRAKKYLEKAVDRLSGWGFSGKKCMSSDYIVVIMAYCHYLEEEKKASLDWGKLKYWGRIVNANGHFGSGSNTVADLDLKTLRDNGVSGLFDRLGDLNKLRYSKKDIIGVQRSSGIYKTLFMALLEDNIGDWEGNGRRIMSRTLNRANEIDEHHIFPKALLKEMRPDLKDDEINQIANIAPIHKDTNLGIGKKRPSEYRHAMSEADLKAHLVDFSDGKDLEENYEQFIDVRAQAIADRLNAFLGLGSDNSDSPLTP